jgi:hypothetical protein
LPLTAAERERPSVSDFVRTAVAPPSGMLAIPSEYRPALAAPARSDFGTLTLLGLAFFGFGLALGELTGLSSVDGISQTLLTSFFTFVGGVLLTYAGFRRFTPHGESVLDPRRVALGLSGVSLGLCLGLPAGIYARCNVNVQSFFAGEQLAHSQCLASVAFPLTAKESGSLTREAAIGLHAGHQSPRCQEAIKALNLAAHTPSHSAVDITERVSALIEACELNKP